MFPRKNLSTVFSDAEKKQIVDAIREAESRTSGEIRVYMESRCKYVEPLDRAVEVFYGLQMEKTADRNAVLLYIAVKDRQLAIFADEGIYAKVGKEYWQQLVARITSHFNKQHFSAGVSAYVLQIGEGLRQYFPFDKAADQNELPDDIVFGK